ncbi:protein CHROMATIN REMODELING 8-like isoform X1 [Chenopodium quinoa]|uniref:Protein CHROMATIN REMODELING 8 n=1 Tax=Chenopodium quinoa TaxID=63459 RepID=A0A803LF99_CHEQI|nr:protein CHROMATIN REMODELING 8-like isoform X1 [Chenopodium quinoa]
MEEEEDTILLNSLGVTSVNPEDIERNILHKARTNAESSSHGGKGTSEVEEFTDSVGNQASSSSQVELLKKLRAIEVEIDAVASSVEHTKSGVKNEEIDSESHGGNEEDDEGFDKAMPNSSTLQHALAADRLKSLKKTRAELRKELSNICEDGKAVGVEEKLLKYLVREESKSKRKLKEVQGPNKESKKKKKVVSYQEDDEFDAVLNAASGGFVETERDELVRKGLFTPFHKLKGFERRIQQPGTSSLQEDRNDTADHASESVARAVRSLTDARQARPTSKLLEPKDLPRLDTPPHAFNRLNKSFKIPKSLDSDGEKSNDSKRKKRRPLPGERWRKRIAKEEFVEEEPDVQDDLITETQDAENGDGGETPSVTLEGGLKIPETIFDNLFDYQKVGVQWLWELHCQRAGGIIGDEMGLGKTIQVLAFLGSLHFSNMYKPSIIVCPVTLLRQWKREARKWYRSFHVEILHDSAVDVGRKQKQSESDESDYESEGSFESDQDKVPSSRSAKKWDSLINRVLRSESGLLITTYEQLRILGEKLLDIEWGYAVLDEGHRIRNPNAEVTIVCKQLQTVHRIIMTGAPIQNKLSELWSLFDFVFPGKLGVLPVFEAEFAVPIKVGGYANASPLQVSTAYRCAVVLRDLIMPYLLRRMKSDVNAHLPKKTEHVLFCSLTPEQRSVYKAFLASSEVEQIFDGNRNSLYGIDVMRKICNHPDLLEREHSSRNPDYGNPERSGKMKVVAQVLNMWKEQGHRVLLFAQTQQMLDILENFLIANEYSYRRMDGLTAVKQRMALIDEFNNSNDVFIFILTTKVGGLGTNLTGANRVIIFDPDWNPSTDMQARERAWRVGQTRDVTIFRLITRGTIEEKVYHRQIYKHFLTNKILKNPQQRRFFKARDLKDLFVLTDEEHAGSTETSHIFGQLPEQLNVISIDKEDQQKDNCSGATTACANDTDRENSPQQDLCGNKEKEGADNGRNTDEETNFLKNLFDTHGIHSAINHDAIMDAHDEEKMRLEEQASQVAQRAAEALRQSRMLRSRENISVPTWTGKSGAAGAPSSVRRTFGSTVNSQLVRNSRSEDEAPKTGTNGFVAGAASGKALSSSELLAKIRGNQASAVGDGLEHQFSLASSSANRAGSSVTRPSRASQNLSGVPPEVLIRNICTFIQNNGGSTSSSTIVEHFRDRIPSNDLPLFKNLLKEIAILEKNRNGSVWVLKPEYQLSRS